MTSKYSPNSSTSLTRIVFLAIFFTTYTLSYSPIFAKINGKITGTITSKQENSPLASATIVLFKSSDSTIANGAVTDKSGKFTISISSENDADKYYLEAKYLGYETKIIPDLEITKSKYNLNLGEIKLNQTAILQEKITIEAEKEAIIETIDSKIFNVDKDLTAGGNTVLDVLRKIPSVNVDIDDNITMNGSSPKILVDGKESNLASKDMLKVLAADLVQSVELITNPSAKYESEGVSGIIDIKLKKEIDDGFNGMVNMYGGGDFELKYSKYLSLGFFGNYKLGKFNLFTNINRRNYGGYNDWILKRSTWLDSDTTFTNRTSESEYSGYWQSFRIGADYNFSDNDMITLATNISGYSSDNENNGYYLIADNSQNPIKNYDDISNSNYSNSSQNISLSYEKKFEEKGHKLYIDTYFVNGPTDLEANTTRNFYPVLLTDTLFIEKHKNIVDDRDSRGIIKIDYEKTIELLGNLGAGYKSIFRKLEYDNKYYLFNNTSNDFEPNLLLTDFGIAN